MKKKIHLFFPKILKAHRGFTFLEILIVIGLIGILTVIAMVSYTSVNRRSRDARRRSDIEQVRSALEMYRADNGYYPDIGSGFMDVTNLNTALVDGEYIAEIPVNPQNADTYPYMIKMLDPNGTGYNTGYCISGYLETLGSDVESSCIGETTLPSGTDGLSYNYAAKNP